jgi:hypothetical protein
MDILIGLLIFGLLGWAIYRHVTKDSGPTTWSTPKPDLDTPPERDAYTPPEVKSPVVEAAPEPKPEPVVEKPKRGRKAGTVKPVAKPAAKKPATKTPAAKKPAATKRSKKA